jgi:predicted nucleic acid-binding protein
VIVVDASALVEVLLNTPAGASARRDLFAAGETLHVPHLADLEVLQVLRRYAMAKILDQGRALEALGDYQSLPLTRYPHSVLLPRIWQLRHNLTAYDAAYIALAEALQAPFLTCDRALASIPGCRAKVRVV